MVASSSSIPRCQPNRSWRSTKRALTRASAGTVALCSSRAMAMPRFDGPNPTPTTSSTSGVEWGFAFAGFAITVLS